jgi:branched-chain amino acid transport system ATP-binding protein
MNLIMDVSDRILALNYGERIAEGLPEEIQKHPEVLRPIWARRKRLLNQEY